MPCLSDFHLSSPLLYKMVPRLMRKGDGSATLAPGKKVLGPDLCVYMALRVPVGLCGNDVSFWLISPESASLCHHLWLGLQPDQATAVLLADWLPTLVGITDLAEVLPHFPPNPQTIWLFAPHHHRAPRRPTSSQLSDVPDMLPLRVMWELLGPTHGTPKPAVTRDNWTQVLSLHITLPNQVPSDVTPTGWGRATLGVSFLQSLLPARREANQHLSRPSIPCNPSNTPHRSELRPP